MSDKDAARRQKVLRKLYRATALCSCFFVDEVAGGFISHSLTVLSDAAHSLEKADTRKTSYLQNKLLLAKAGRNKGDSRRRLAKAAQKRLAKKRLPKAASKGRSQNFKYSSKPRTATIFTPR
jgi:hypothetical protein